MGTERRAVLVVGMKSTRAAYALKQDALTSFFDSLTNGNRQELSMELISHTWGERNRNLCLHRTINR